MRSRFSGGNQRLDFGDLAVFDAAGANAHALGIAFAVSHAHGLKVGQKATLGNTGGVQTDTAFVLRRTLANDNIAG